ncbi:hypothetical protein [Anabaena sp. CCY 9402-a]
MAKKIGLISNVKSVMDDLITQTTFSVGEQLYESILK